MTPQRLVLRMPNWLGDIVMAMPAIATVRRHFAGARLAVAAPAAFVDLCRALPDVDDVVALEGRGLAGLGRRAAALAAGRFDLAILLTNSFATALEARRAGIGERWGVRRDFRGPLLTRAVERPRRSDGGAGNDGPPGIPPRHHARYYLEILRALGIGPASGFAALHVAAGPEASARALLEERGWSPGQPLVAIAPGAAYGAAKRWPADHAAVVVAALEGRGVRTVLVGAGADRDAARAIESAVARGVRGVPRPLDLVGATDLAQLMGVMACCRLVVSNDSGAMHVASAVGRPVVAVFGPTDETATAPLGPHTIVRHDVWCRPCLLRECPLDHACMREVRPDMVIEAVTRWLRQDRHEEQA